MIGSPSNSHGSRVQLPAATSSCEPDPGGLRAPGPRPCRRYLAGDKHEFRRRLLSRLLGWCAGKSRSRHGGHRRHGGWIANHMEGRPDLHKAPIPVAIRAAYPPAAAVLGSQPLKAGANASIRTGFEARPCDHGPKRTGTVHRLSPGPGSPGEPDLVKHGLIALCRGILLPNISTAASTVYKHGSVGATCEHLATSNCIYRQSQATATATASNSPVDNREAAAA